MVAYPLAKAVVEHIEKHGVPKALSEVEGLPYKLKCSEQSVREQNETDYQTKKEYLSYVEVIESCSFAYDEKLYRVNLRIGTGVVSGRIGVYMDITHNLTRAHYEVHYLAKENRWKYAHYPQAIIVYIGKGLCINTYRPVQ